jgi:polyhydroxybutyrate depolymerase
MTVSSLLVATFLIGQPMLKPGDHTRNLKVDGRDRSYLVHIPKKCDGKTPTPVVLALHGAAMNGPMMTVFCGLNKKADEAGFIVVYPSGGAGMGIFLTWNAGGRTGKDRPDDVAYIRAALDDLGSVVKVDPKRVYATGMSNGGMMCYLLAAELPDRIAAVAPVSGTMVIEKASPKRPVPIMHFHGTADTLVPFDGLRKDAPKFGRFKSVEDSIKTWVKIDGCNDKPESVSLPDKAKDGTTIERRTYGHGKDGTEVVLVVIKGGGHTWPGEKPLVDFIGKSTKNISANDLIWEFFQKHPMP